MVAFGLCHTLRLITNFIEMFCERLSLPRVSKPRASEDMDGTLKDLQGPDLFFNLLKVVISAAPIPAFSGKVQILNFGAEYTLLVQKHGQH